MNKRLRLPLALSLALGSSSAFALGLGQIEVKSALNQPLAAEIPVLSTLAGETDALVVRLAPPEALERVGLPAPTGVAANLEFSLDTNSRGQTVIRVTTPSKVSDPFVSFLIEVDWGKGKILREYTVLLDPPTMASLRGAPAASAPVAEAMPAVSEPLPEALPPPPMAEAAPEPAFEPIPDAPPAETTTEAVAEAPPEPEPMPEPEPAPTPTRVDTYGPVAAGETLWSIATYARPDSSVSMNQMMLALLHANPDAFIDQNINRLKKGAILRIPAREETMLVAAADAAAQVREQMQVWRQANPSVMQPAEPEPSETPSPRATATAPRTADSRLELVPPRGDSTAVGAQSGASVAGEGRELRAELARTREEASTLSQENVDLKSRVGELEKIRQDSERLIALKNSELAAAQQRLAELQARADAAPVAADAAVDAAVAPSAGPDGAPPTAAEGTVGDATAGDASSPSDTPAAATPEAADATADTSDTTATAPAVSPAQTAPIETVAEPMPPRPLPAPWYMSPWVLGGGGLVVVGLLALLLGRRKSAAAPAPSGRYGTGEMASSIAAVKAGSSAPAKASAAAAKAAAHAPEAKTVDRAAELAEAVTRDPSNLARHLDLVRHHYEKHDAASFEHAAEAMYSRVYDPEHLAWKQVVAMGHEIAPEHPLFVQEVAVVATPAAVPVPVAAPAPAAPREVSWSAQSAADNSKTQQLRVDQVQSAQAAPSRPVPAAPVFEAPSPVEEFNFDLPSDEPATATAAVEPEDSGFIDADAASTKLELARAYLDMGDVEGARGMLEEVVSEGNPGQRAEAKRLLDEIR